MSRVIARFTVLMLIFSVIECGCSANHRKPTDPNGSVYLPNTTPENVLHNLAASLEHHDFDAYVGLCDPRFSFVYAAHDQGAFGMPDTHDLAVELCAARTICSDPRVDTLWVVLAFDTAFAVSADSLPPGACMQINARCCDVGLLGPWPNSDAEVLYMNFGDPQVFLFSGDTTDAGHVEYHILRHIDAETGLPCSPLASHDPSRITPQSWGWLKHKMYQVSTDPGGPCSP